MKVIFSRKGFDSSAGGKPSPIISGQMLSLPIPMWSDVRYSDLSFEHKEKRVSYDKLIKDLNTAPYSHCHLDPDIRRDIMLRNGKWRAGFGQCGNAGAELNDVMEGDLFLFFGWFRHAEIHNGKYRYVPNTPDFHAVWGYLEVKERIEVSRKKRAETPIDWHYHPHYTDERLWSQENNMIFTAKEHLSYCTEHAGYGTFDFNTRLILTHDHSKNGRKSFWKPLLFLNRLNRHKSDTAELWNSGGRGQELVMEVGNDSEFRNWLVSLFGRDSDNMKR